MQRLVSLLSIMILAAFLAECTPKQTASLENPASVPHDPPASCPVTHAPDVSFIAPDPYPPKPPERYANQFWYGTPELWTMLGKDATWSDLPHDRYGYSQKIFWWSQDFHRDTNPNPALAITIERLDVPSIPRLVSREATNASADFGTAMLTGVDIPAPGCGKITGQYQDAELSFVVWVAP
jgi:hypothetical protein